MSIVICIRPDEPKNPRTCWQVSMLSDLEFKVDDYSDAACDHHENTLVSLAFYLSSEEEARALGQKAYEMLSENGADVKFDPEFRLE